MRTPGSIISPFAALLLAAAVAGPVAAQEEDSVAYTQTEWTADPNYREVRGPSAECAVEVCRFNDRWISELAVQYTAGLTHTGTYGALSDRKLHIYFGRSNPQPSDASRRGVDGKTPWTPPAYNYYEVTRGDGTPVSGTRAIAVDQVTAPGFNLWIADTFSYTLIAYGGGDHEADVGVLEVSGYPMQLHTRLLKLPACPPSGFWPDGEPCG